MKLILFNEAKEPKFDENGGVIEPEQVALTDMCFLFASYYQNNADNDNNIRYVYAAHDEAGNTLCFAQFYTYDKEDQNDLNAVLSMKSAGIFMDNDSSEPAFNIASFLLKGNNGNGIITDFTSSFDKENNLYKIYGTERSDSETDMKTRVYTIPRNVMVGIFMINRCICNGNYSGDAFYEANLWLDNSGDRANAIFDKVSEMSVIDVSKSIKQSGYHCGIVALKVDIKNSVDSVDSLFCTMKYMRDKKLRDRHKCIDLDVLSEKYKNSWTIGLFAGLAINQGDNSTQFLAVMDDRYCVLTIPQSVYKKFALEVASL